MLRQRFEAEGIGHDWWHIARVRNMAVRIAHEENADVVVVELAALLHQEERFRRFFSPFE
jgi:uncharacterized protein